MISGMSSGTSIESASRFLRNHLGLLGLARRNPRILIGVGVILGFVACALLAPLIAPYDPIKIDLRAKYQPPSASHLLGTDYIGRDVLSRLIWGSRVSLLTAILSITFAVVILGAVLLIST